MRTTRHGTHRVDPELDPASAWATANPASRSRHELARGLLPDGVAHDVRRGLPFPLTIWEASGSRKTDIDGHDLLCYVMGHGALLLGHGDPEVVEAIATQAARLLHGGSNHEGEAEWAREVVDLIPSAERVRFTSSGTEATLLSLQVARASTGRRTVLKLKAHYHGWNEHLMIGSDPPFDRVPPGANERLLDDVIVAPADADTIASLLGAHEVAAVILEPAGALSGAVPLPPGLLERLRATTDQHGTVLIFDEVVTGFRFAPGGVQQAAGVTPDLTTLGKVVAGGMPGGALCGRAPIMAALETRPDRPKVPHPGTHNAHPVSAAAGITTLRRLRDGEPQRVASARANTLKEAFDAVMDRRGVAGFCYGPSSHLCLFLGEERPDGPEHGIVDTIGTERLRRGITGQLSTALHCAMLLEGVHLFHGHGFPSAAHTEADVEQTIDAFDRAIGRLQASGHLAG